MTTSNTVNVTKSPDFNNETDTPGCTSDGIETVVSEIVGLIFGLVMLVTSWYIFLVLCISLHRFLKKQRGRSPSVNTTSVLANTNSKLGLSMRFVATAVSLLCVVHFLLHTVLLYYECCPGTLYIVKVLIYGLIVVLNYIFFWLRQRVLYDAPTMKLFHSKLLRTLSWLSLGLIIMCSMAQIVSALLIPEVNKPTWIYLSWLIECIAVQAVLLSLFLYPLRKHSDAKRALTYEYYERKRSSQKRPNRSLEARENGSIETGIRDSIIFTVTTAVGPKGSASSVKRLALTSGNPLYHAARRCAVCAAVVSLSDITAVVFLTVTCHFEWQSEWLRILGNFLCNFNLVLNAFFVVGSFGTWRRMLFPDFIRTLPTKLYCFRPTHTLRHKVFKTFSNQGK